MVDAVDDSFPPRDVHDFKESMNLMREKIPANPWITHESGLADYKMAFEVLAGSEKSIRMVIKRKNILNIFT